MNAVIDETREVRTEDQLDLAAGAVELNGNLIGIAALISECVNLGMSRIGHVLRAVRLSGGRSPWAGRPS